MKTVNWNVKGMSCTNCALTINKYLKGKGAENIKVNFIGGDVSFDIKNTTSEVELIKGIDSLGYKVVDQKNESPEIKRNTFLSNHFQRFLFCIAFTLPLLIHMVPGVHIHVLMNPLLQLGLTIPVYIVGMNFFGRSAMKSLKSGIPNMNVLIALGSSAAFAYSLYGTMTNQAEQFMFYETAASIITLVFLGNYLEEKSVESTQIALKKLVVSQTIMANLIAYDDQHNEHVFPVEATSLKTGDLVLIKDGEQVPSDCKILWGNANVNEAILTGESLPIEKKTNDILIGGSILESGTIKAYITAVGDKTVMNNIIKMVKDAQTEKPPVQQLADKISALFVPLVVGVAVITLIANYIMTDIGFTQSLLRSIAVLVIACPCAMGLATPAAVAVGLGRAAKNGVLFRNAKSLELFKNITQVVFDKTGTLTTGQFKVSNIQVSDATITIHEFKSLVYSLEKFSNHPIAKCISKEFKTKDTINWTSVEEIKGQGVKAKDKEDNTYMAGSFKILPNTTIEQNHNVYITKNNSLIGWIDLADEIRLEAKQVIDILKSKGIKSILLSGDKKEKCDKVAFSLGINEVIAEQTPAQKLDWISKLSNASPTAMIGDGINDAPALSKATIGISMSDASKLAMQTASVVLMNNGLSNLPLSLGLGKHTYITIKQNLTWAFLYNIVAIPVAAFGFLSPAFGALIMGLSDVVLVINSVRLNYKKVI